MWTKFKVSLNGVPQIDPWWHDHPTTKKYAAKFMCEYIFIIITASFFIVNNKISKHPQENLTVSTMMQ